MHDDSKVKSTISGFKVMVVVEDCVGEIRGIGNEKRGGKKPRSGKFGNPDSPLFRPRRSHTYASFNL